MFTAARADARPVTIGGTGAALAAAQSLVHVYASKETPIEAVVLPSLGSSGGLRALEEGEVDIALSSRPLRPEETAKGLRDAACVTTALVLATSHANPPGVKRAELPAIYADAKPKWPDGTPLKVILRSRDGSEHAALAKIVPAVADAIETAQKRPGVAVGVTDQDNVELAARMTGSLAITTLLQLRSENLPLRPVAIDDVVPSPETIASGSYPMPLRICLVVSPKTAPAALRLVEFSRSPSGQSFFRERGAEPLP